MPDVLAETEEAENNPHQPDGLDLHVAQAAEVSPQSAGPGILPSQEVVSQEVLGLRFDLLEAKQEKVRAVTAQQAGEIEAVGELDGHVPCDQLEAEYNNNLDLFTLHYSSS